MFYKDNLKEIVSILRTARCKLSRRLATKDRDDEISQSGKDVLVFEKQRYSYPLFNGEWYLSQNADVIKSGSDPLEHYLSAGAAEGRDPNPFFDSDWYLHKNPDVKTSGMNPLKHYICFGAREGSDPSPFFDSDWYLNTNPDVKASGMNPLEHYLASGAVEGRNPSPDFEAFFYNGYDCDTIYTKMKMVWESIFSHPAALENPESIAEDDSSPIFEKASVKPIQKQFCHILVIDQQIPMPDQDSGSVRMMAILRLLREMGLRVGFASNAISRPEDLRQAEQYQLALKEIGIEVLYGFEAVLRHLQCQGDGYKYVLLSRPEIALRYLAAVRAYASKAEVIYDMVDLHSRRIERAAKLTKDQKLIAVARRYRRIEQRIAIRSDLVIAVTPEDKEGLLALAPGTHFELVPNIHSCRESVRTFESRQDFMFIGGFAHPPNIDAVLWFVETILPLIHRELPGTVFNVIGSKVPVKIKHLATSMVNILGYVQNPEPYFANCRVSLAPLRYGAGMKGKIGQSMSYGLPVVTTRIGAEGMGLIDGENAMIADTPETFCKSVVRLYTDEALWSKIAKNSIRHIQNNFSNEAIKHRLEAIFK